VTIVLVHGNPETNVVWESLVGMLDRDDVVRLSPPGFGAPAPEEFGATLDEYRDWLIGELEALDRPVDLVGHDWGGAHVVNVAMTRPDLLRSWCTDVAGVFDPEYVWNDLAQMWQTPGKGELAVADMLATSFPERAAGLIGFGVAPDIAELLAPAIDEDMGRCVLGLYRSAVQPRMSELGRGLPAAAERPGLALYASKDRSAGTETMHRRSAKRAGATLAVLPDLGHWWMTQDPHRAARALNRFWASLPD